MNWTKQIPTVGGWYWIKNLYGTYIEYVNEGGKIWSDFYESYLQLNEDDGYEFYGPIEEPKGENK